MSNWTWRPELGRWHLLEYGFPVTPEKVALSTSSVNQREAYDYWRQVAFPDFEPDDAPREKRLAFHARATAHCWERGDLFTTESGALSGSRSARQADADGLDGISIGLVLDGQRHSEQEGDREMLVGPRGFYVYDASRPSRVSWTQHKSVFMSVRRHDVLAALGEIPSASEMMQRVAQSSIRHVLADQFRMLARHLDYLAPNEQAYLIDQTIQLSLFALANPSRGNESGPSDGALFRAALRFIEYNLVDPKLDAGRLARALNCSRATLYRAFASEGIGVAEVIRDIRLEHARVFIEQLPAEVSLSEIAVRCGIYDTTNFSRQFRRRFGISPSDLRLGEQGRSRRPRA